MSNQIKMNFTIIGVYIPRVNMSVNEEFVKDAFKIQGKQVSRVDFTSIGKKPGFTEDFLGEFKAAFVHFKVTTTDLKLQSIWKAVNEGKGYKFYPSYISSEYWLLLPAKNPIPHTMMNNSQIVENCRYLEALIEEQAKTIEEQECRIEEQECRIEEQERRIEKLFQMAEANQSVVYQLLGGLYNHVSQSQVLHDHLNVLFSENLDSPSRYEEDTHKWKNWPTTRQGDDSERRIAILEEKVKALTKFNPTVFDEETEEQQDTELMLRKQLSNMYTHSDNDSTHSSMPDLIDVYGNIVEDDSDESSSTHSSMPELVSDDDSISTSTTDSKDRVRNSFELCGNE